jgi:hypothetical protein
MINAQELKEQISESDVITVLKLLGAKTFTDTKEAIITETVCHKGHSHKLYYYKESRMFHCYTDCGDNFDIIELVKRNKKYVKINFAIQWIATQLGIDTYTYGFQKNEKIDIINDWDFINEYINRKQRKKELNILSEINKNVLNIYQDMYLEDWINEGISIKSMKKYEIKYSTLKQKIIIPHKDIDNRLVGIRARATIAEEVELYGKYAPMTDFKGNMFSHPLSQNLYGLGINKETIKQKKKVMLVESEKGVLQTDTMFGNKNFTVALCGNTLSNTQRDMLLSLGIEEVIIGLDRQYKEVGDVEYEKWSKHIRDRIISKLAPYVRVYVIWDTESILGYKDSPTDCGKDKLLYLMKNKIYVGTYNESEVVV